MCNSVIMCSECGDTISIIYSQYCDCGGTDDVEQVICSTCKFETNDEKIAYLKESEKRIFLDKMESTAQRFFIEYNQIMNYKPVESEDLYEDGYYEYRANYVRYKNKISTIDDLSQTYSKAFANQISDFQYLIHQFQQLDRFQDKYDSYIEGRSLARDELIELDAKYWKNRSEQKEEFEKAYNELFVPINEDLKFAYVAEKYYQVYR